MGDDLHRATPSLEMMLRVYRLSTPYPECTRPLVLAAMRDGWRPSDGPRPGLPSPRFIASWLRASASLRIEVAAISPGWLAARTRRPSRPSQPGAEAHDATSSTKRTRNTPPRFKRTPEVRAATLEALRGGAKVHELGPGLPTAWIIRQWRREGPSFDAEIEAINRATRRRGAFTYGPADKAAVLDAMRAGGDMQDLGDGFPKIQVIRSWRKTDAAFEAEVMAILHQQYGDLADNPHRGRILPRTDELRRAILAAYQAGNPLARLGDGLPSGKFINDWRNDDPSFAAELDAIYDDQDRPGRYLYGCKDKAAVLDAVRAGGRAEALGEGFPRPGVIRRWRSEDPAFEAELMAIYHERFGGLAAHPQRAQIIPKTDELRQSILAAYRSGMPLRKLGDDLPSIGFIVSWRDKDPSFDTALTAARPAFLAAYQERQDALSRRRAASATSRRLLLESEAYAAADKVVGRGYAPDVREDLVSEIMLAILDSSVALADVKSAAPRIISAYWRGRDTYRCQSMDAMIFDGKKGTLHDLIGC